MTKSAENSNVKRLNQDGVALQSFAHLNEFMRNMNKLWGKFDRAYTIVISEGYERQLGVYSDKLDSFFICYWEVFNCICNKNTKPETIKALADKQYIFALHHLGYTWHSITHDLVQRADAIDALKSKLHEYEKTLQTFQAVDPEKQHEEKTDEVKRRISNYIRISVELHKLLEELNDAPAKRS